MKYAITIIKATRKPFILKENLSLEEAMIFGDVVYETFKKSSKPNYCPSGIGVRLIRQENCVMLCNIEVGCIPSELCEFSWGGC